MVADPDTPPCDPGFAGRVPAPTPGPELPRPEGVDVRGRLAIEVAPADAGARIDRLLGRLLAPHYSRSYLAALIEEGSITVDGRKVRPAFRLRPGARIAGPLGRPASSLPDPEPMDLAIVHEDEAIVVIDKPVGLVIHPGTGAREGTLVNGLLHHDPSLARVGRADRPGIVHRLDRDTSGVMVVARTNEAARAIVQQFKAKTVRKEYTAVVWGEMPFDSDWIDLPLGQHPRRPQLRAVVREGGQPASTFYEVVRRLGRATLVSAFPRTGRTHQIRVHLDHIGFTIVGDAQYGPAARESFRRWVAAREEAGSRVPALERHALHARRLTFRHPLSGREETYEAPLPPDIVDVIEVLASEQAGAGPSRPR